MFESAGLRQNANCDPVKNYMHIRKVFINMKFIALAIEVFLIRQTFVKHYNIVK